MLKEINGINERKKIIQSHDPGRHTHIYIYIYISAGYTILKL